MKILKLPVNAAVNLKNAISALAKTKFNVNTIRFKLISAFLITIIPIVFLGVISFNSAKTAISQVARQSSLQTLDQSNRYFSLLMSNINAISTQVLSNSSVQDYIDNNFSDDMEALEARRKVDDLLNNLLLSNDYLANISIICDSDKDAYALSSYVSTYTFNQFMNEPYYKKMVEADGGPVWYGRHPQMDENIKYASNIESSYSISCMRVVRSINLYEVKAILIVDVKENTIRNAISNIDMGSNGSVHLVTQDNVDISNLLMNNAAATGDTEASATVETTGTSTTSAVEPKDSKSSVHMSDITGESFYSTLVNSNKSADSKTIQFNGQSHLMAYTKIADTGMCLVGLIPTNQLYMASNQIIGTTVISVIVAALVAIIIGFYIAMGMGRTINRIIKATGLAALGDLTVNPVSKRKDELGQLTKSINSMISNMRSLIRHASEITQTVAHSAATVSDTSQQVSSVSHEISKAIQEISQGASEQASDAEQSSTKMDELAAKINYVADNADAIERYSKETMDLTQNGLVSVVDLNEKAKETTSMTTAIIGDIQTLDSHSKSIGKIVKVISGIADQTNLLALNATIEAARAGEAGKGFAVVADEVRKLAEQSMSATHEISSIIKDTQSQTAKAVERAKASEKILNLQNEAVDNTLSIFKRISTSMEQLVEKVENIMGQISEMNNYKEQAITAIQSISAVSEETAASTEEVTASTQEQLSGIEELSAFAQELGDAAKSLSEAISKFKVE